MASLNDEVLKDIFSQSGKIQTPSKNGNSEEHSSEDETSLLAKLLLSGKEMLKTGSSFFSKVTTAILHEDGIEFVTDKNDSAKFSVEVVEIKSIFEQMKITRLECTKFDAKFLPFWKAVSSSIKEFKTADFQFDNKDYAQAVGELKALEKATIELDIYCIGFLEGISLHCSELTLIGEAFDQIENEEFQSLRLPSVKKLTIRGHYVGWGITDMSLESTLKNLKVGFPNVNDLTLIIDDDNVADEEAKTILELVSKPKLEEGMHLKVIFNFTMMETTWEESSFAASLKKHPGIELTGSKDGSQSKLQLPNKLVEINLLSDPQSPLPQPQNNSSDGDEEAPAKRQKLDSNE